MTNLYLNHPDGSRNDLGVIGANNTRLSGDNGGSGRNAPGSSTVCLVDIRGLRKLAAHLLLILGPKRTVIRPPGRGEGVFEYCCLSPLDEGSGLTLLLYSDQASTLVADGDLPALQRRAQVQICHRLLQFKNSMLSESKDAVFAEQGGSSCALQVTLLSWLNRFNSDRRGRVTFSLIAPAGQLMILNCRYDQVPRLGPR